MNTTTTTRTTTSTAATAAAACQNDRFISRCFIGSWAMILVFLFIT